MKFTSRTFLLLAAMLLAGTFTACGGMGGPSQNAAPGVFDSMPEVTAPETAASSQSATIPEGAIADESGEFVYTGKLEKVGDDENGYIQIPLGFVRFQDADADGLCQYSDISGKNIITLDRYDKIEYSAAAESMRVYLSQQENAEGLSGAMASPNGYDAYQVYCHYTDGYFLVSWFIKDPADAESCYHLSMEFDSEHTYMMACSSTFQPVSDHQQSGSET